MAIKSLIINPGSTSTKIGIFEDEELKMDETLRHSTEEISKYDSIIDQKDFRKNIILDFLKEKNIDVKTFDVIVGRGGLLKPIEGGTYEVTDAVIKDLEIGVQGQHASNLGGILAREIADQIGVKAYIVDPVVVDELSDVARVSGMPDVQRTSIFHPLNQKAVARRYAKSVGKKYEDLRLVVAHLGGGVSVGAHDHGRIVDVYSAFEGDGAMSPERCGGLPTGALIRLCYSGKFSEKEMLKKATGAGGFNAYLGTNDAREVMKKIDAGDEKARLIMDAFIYQVCKDIGAQATVLKGKVDQIIITGGIAYNDRITSAMKERIGFIAPVTVYPGEDELLALAQGAIRVMNGEEKAKVY
ncbi:butyrate kinase [Butyrivibrio fibrisolvens]|uniref:butyrate kinase n=1 Tax=Butyrivibrio fibrisolvens TaxID=831 RepID=UPI0003FD2037|nr:butyrate kinase [Butyrivibrio fibrisolvens]